MVLVLVAAVGWFGLRLWSALAGEPESTKREDLPVPVEVATVERGPIELKRRFSGTLESIAEFEVTTKVGGRIVSLNVNVADPLKNGGVIAEMDRDEFELSVKQSEAELEVARANLAEALSIKEISDRTMQRQESLHQRGVASDVQLDVAEAEQLAAGAQVSVAQANLLRAEAALQTARIRLGYTTVRATWGTTPEGEKDDTSRRVAHGVGSKWATRSRPTRR